MLNTAMLESLVQVVGKENLLSDPYDLDRYSGDALNPYRAFGAEQAFERLADAVARPASPEEISQIVTLAGRQGVPVIPYGGGTGVMGGVLPVSPKGRAAGPAAVRWLAPGFCLGGAAGRHPARLAPA